MCVRVRVCVLSVGYLFTEDKSAKWSKVQMWQVLCMVVSSPSGAVLYDDVLFNIFSGDDAPLKALVRVDLLRVEPALSRGGDRVRAGSPVFLEAFRRLVQHQSKLRPGMDLLVLQAQTQKEQGKINLIEEELMRIAQTAEEVMGNNYRAGRARATVGGGGGDADFLTPWGGSGRVDKGSYSFGPHGRSETSYLLQRQAFLVQLLHDSHTKIAGYDVKRRVCEKEIKKLKQIE